MNIQLKLRHEIDVIAFVEKPAVTENPEVSLGTIFHSIDAGVIWHPPKFCASMTIRDLETILTAMKEFDQWPVKELSNVYTK